MSKELDKINFLIAATAEEVRDADFAQWDTSVRPDNSTGMRGFTGDPEMAVGSVTGYRWWNMGLGAFKGLTGAYGGSWAPEEEVYEAECRRSGRWGATYGLDGHHPVPDPDCGCGFWAYWRPESNNSFGGSYTFAVVQGVLEGFGMVLIGDKGFRAGKARLKGLAIDTDELRRTLTRQRKPFANSEYGAQATFNAITGRTYSRGENLPEDLVTCAVAELETALEELYPSAKVFSSTSTMQTYFGYDKNYGYASARNPDVKDMGKEWLADALIRLQSLAWEVTSLFHCAKLGEVKQSIDLVKAILSEF